jgi:hypothetical protein
MMDKVLAAIAAALLCKVIAYSFGGGPAVLAAGFMASAFLLLRKKR